MLLKQIMNSWNLKHTISSLFHLVAPSGFPVIMSMSLFLTMLNLMSLMSTNLTSLMFFVNKLMMSTSFLMFLINIALWLFKVLNESYSGEHSKYVAANFRLGFLLFISSEMMLFFAVFWGWFHMNLLNEFIYAESHSTNYLDKIDWFPLPAIGTMMLGSSSAFLTESHYSLNWLIFNTSDRNLFNFFKYKHIISSYRLLRMTCYFGFLFLMLQYIEYTLMGYSWRAHIYSSFFYIMTSLHGSHVLMGLLFLIVVQFRLMFYVINLSISKLELFFKMNLKYFQVWILELDLMFNSMRYYFNTIFNAYSLKEQRHIFLEVSAWYWHFVDIVWFFVFIFVYFWLKGFYYYY